ncbi:unnamed protein product [Absidia cylindrospora]
MIKSFATRKLGVQQAHAHAKQRIGSTTLTVITRRFDCPSLRPQSLTRQQQSLWTLSAQFKRLYNGGGTPGNGQGGFRLNPNQEQAEEKALEKYGLDLTAMAEKGKLDPVIGRDEEIRRTLEV